MTYILDFSPPARGIEGTFNTVRLGGAWAKRLAPGDRVLLVERPKSILIGAATIEHVEVGTLRAIATEHAHRNHNQIVEDDAEGAPDRLVTAMIKRYGPHKCNENSKVTMILMRREPPQCLPPFLSP